MTTRHLSKPTNTNRNPFSTTSLNLAKDGIMFAKPPWWWDLLDIAQTCVDIGFFLPHKFLPPLGVAHCITNYSLQFFKMMAQSFLIGSIGSNAHLGGHARW
jgi:hypothetical protein